jgi:hypothetical protein
MDPENRAERKESTVESAMTLPAEQEEKEDRGSPMAYVRRGGLLAVVGGASMVLVPFLHPESPQSASWVPMHLAYFATLMVILLGLVGIFAYQIGRAGRLGVAGFLGAFFGTAMALLEGREHLFSHTFGQGTPEGLWQLMATALVFSVGYVLLGIAVARAGVLPRGAGVLLAAGAPLVAFAPPIGVQPVIIVGHTLFGVGLAWAGYALFTERRNEQRDQQVAHPQPAVR